MPFIKSTILAGAAALAFAATAHGAETHVMTVQLPDGGVARITYQGDTPPQVVVAPGVPILPIMAPLFAPAPFAALDRQADAMLREAALMAQAPGAQVVSTTEEITTEGACTRRTEITYTGNGAAPRQATSVSGNCGQPAHAKPSYADLVRDAVYMR